MLKKLMINQFWLLVTLFVSSFSYGQSFEGWILYKIEVLNPNPEMIPDSAWQQGIKEQLGDRNYILQKYYYKHDKYISEIDGGTQKGYQAFNTNDKLLYSWEVNSDTAVVIDSRKYIDKFVEIVDHDNKDTILGIPCRSVIVKSAMGKMTLWYNSEFFEMDASLFTGHKYGHWEEILKKTGSLPLKIEQKAFMSHIIQTAIEYKVEPVNDSRFVIPEFNTIIEDPTN